MSGPRLAVPSLSAALLAAAMPLVLAARSADARPAAPPPPTQTQLQASSLAEANAALQAGEADKALALLASQPSSGPGLAQAKNLLCRVRLTLEEWSDAGAECEQAVRLDAQNSDYHLWLGRALGQKAARASFVTAYSLAKRTRAEFEEAVRLNSRNTDALADLGNFYRQAPGVVGGGVDKAEEIATQLDQVDPSHAHQLRGDIAEQQKDFTAAESEFKQGAAGPHPAVGLSNLAGFYARRKRYPEMEAAIHSVVTAAARDKHAGVALYDGAGLLIESNREPALAATMLNDYLAGSSKTEEAPAFVAHLRLARLKDELGDPAAAGQERDAALALAREYKPAQDFKVQQSNPQQGRF